jgi:Tol biopolymer transport system component
MNYMKGLLLSILLLFNAGFVFAGNRVIVKKFDWRTHSTKHFDIYYYKDSKGWLKYAASSLERAYLKVSSDLNPSLNKRIPFFLYASQNDMQQTSIAYISDGTGGITEPLKDRFMMWGDGSKAWMDNLIDHEFTHEVQFSVLIDGFWKSARILKTFIYPLWMMEGLAEYETAQRDMAIQQMYVRDASIDDNLIKLLYMNHFGHLKPHQMTLAYKQSSEIIHFLASQYGKEKLPQILELYKTRYDVSSVLRELIGLNVFEFDKKFREYTHIKYSIQLEEESLDEPNRYGEKITKQEDDIPEFNTSAQIDSEGEILAYFSTKKGHPISLCIKNLVTGKEKVIKAISMGIENIPSGRFSKTLKSLSMSSDGKWLVFSGQKNHREALYFYNIETGKSYSIRVPELMEMRQPSFSNDASKIVFVGMHKGFNDIYEIKFDASLFNRDISLSDIKRLTRNNDDESSPAYSPDGEKVAYSCEVEREGLFERDICMVDMKGNISREIKLKADQYDPIFSPDGKSLVFINDADKIFEVYKKDLETKKIYRLTRTRGGNFSPAYSGDGLFIYFSSFRHGNMNIFKADIKNFLYEETGTLPADVLGGDFKKEIPAGSLASMPIIESTGTYKKFKRHISTDLFYPAFMFSSPGGLFWMNYWQLSDMMGYNNIGLFLTYNSGSNYLNYQMSYSYTKFRPQFFAQVSGFTLDGITDSLDLEYDKRYSKQVLGMSYPFDRHNRIEFAGVRKNNKNVYTDVTDHLNSKTRAFQTSFIRNTISGLYLTANSGNRLELSYVKADEFFDGNEKYDVWFMDNLKYFPLSKRSTIVARTLTGISSGRNKLTFNFGGLGGVRGFQRSSDSNESPNVIMGNFELRTPIIDDLNYYMWYMFPDFYFKSVYLKVFADSAYGFENSSKINNFGASSLDTSFGLGLNIHTFVLQSFQMVLSFDYAVRASDGGKIFYFYLGPLF